MGETSSSSGTNRKKTFTENSMPRTKSTQKRMSFSGEIFFHTHCENQQNWQCYKGECTFVRIRSLVVPLHNAKFGNWWRGCVPWKLFRATNNSVIICTSKHTNWKKKKNWMTNFCLRFFFRLIIYIHVTSLFLRTRNHGYWCGQNSAKRNRCGQPLVFVAFHSRMTPLTWFRNNQEVCANINFIIGCRICFHVPVHE